MIFHFVKASLRPSCCGFVREIRFTPTPRIIDLSYPQVYASRPLSFSTRTNRGRQETSITDHSNVLCEDEILEEEEVPGYNAQDFYPVQLGDVFHSRYRVLAKLGFGTASTIWLSKDIITNNFATLKICITGRATTNELAISQHIRGLEAEHPGLERIRVAIDDFEIEGPSGNHQCLVYAPLGMNYTEFRNRMPGQILPKRLLQQSLLMILLGVDLLHQAGVVHTGVTDMSAFSKIEELETESPSPRKILSDRNIYLSYKMPITYGAPMISDFGSALLGVPGQKFSGDVMPGVYRAPEIILGMQWDSKIDIWSIALMIWDLFEGGRLFRAMKNGRLDDDQHLAEMVSILGPPPRRFLELSDKCRQYWDEEGNWIGTTPIPKQTLETRETQLQGKDKELLIRFARKVLCWLPEDRPSAEDLFDDEFLNQFRVNEEASS
ncbi:protein kinase [Aureobasidium subglaciale]|nr:protein kinase [Aureobasidium subglaciale]